MWAEVKRLQDIIVGLRVEHGGQEYGYQDICAKWNGQCYTNSLLSFADTFAVLSKGVFKDSVENYYRNYSEKLTSIQVDNGVKILTKTDQQKNILINPYF